MKRITLLVAAIALILGAYSYLYPTTAKAIVMRLAFDGLVLKEKYLPTAGLEGNILLYYLHI